MAGIGIKQRFVLYLKLIRLDKPIGFFLLLWPTLWALWIASSGQVDMTIVAVFTAGVFLMRSAGCVINDFADRAFDPRVERTKNRPLASGAIHPQEALLIFILLCSLAFAIVLVLNPMTIMLSAVAVVLAAIYPYMKRYTYLPQVHLGMAFGWAIPMAFAAVLENIPAEAWLLYLATILWAVVYDTMYAMVDREDDLKIGVKSTAILFGDADRFIIAIIQIMVLLTLFLLGQQLNFHWYYWAGLGVALLFFIYQQILIKNQAPVNCLRAFKNNNLVGLAIFAGIFAQYYWG